MTPESLSAMQAETHGDPGPATLDIERLEGLLAKATPGPWEWYDNGVVISDDKIVLCLDMRWAHIPNGEDFELLRGGQTALPHLLAIAKAHLAKPTRPYGHDMSDTPLLDRLRMWIQPSHKPYPTHQMNPDGDEAAAEIDALRAEVGRLREVLAGLIPARVCLNNRNVPDHTVIPCDVTIGELRAAAAALENRHG